MSLTLYTHPAMLLHRPGPRAEWLGIAGAQAKGGSPSWHGLTYHGAMLGTRGAYACDAAGRAHVARSAVRICRIGY